MQTSPDTTQSGTKGAKWMTFMGVALCALCCAAPLLGAIGLGSAFLSAVAGSLELAGMVLFVSGLAWLGLRYAQQARSKANACGQSCSVDCACKTAAG